ncbi:MAG: methionine adenosyltransferase, partial [Chloroflexota bacterium]
MADTPNTAPAAHRYARIVTSESVTEGHPDKLCDQVSDAILDAFLARDPGARVACETVAAGNAIWVHGEITANPQATADIDIDHLVRSVVRDIGYTDPDFGLDAETCAVHVGIRPQAPEISGAVGVEGAGDQGMMYGYACDETQTLMPLPIDLAHRLARRLTGVRRDGTIGYLRPDGKTQVTVGYDAGGRPAGIAAIVVSAQHHPGIELAQIHADLRRHVIDPVVPAELIGPDTRFHLNPSGSFTLGGPTADTGLTGRKVIVDTYGGVGRHGGGCFSGKDATKVDRSGAYAARQAAKWIVERGLASRAEVSVAYAIGVAAPLAVNVDSFGTGADGRTDAELSALVTET